MTMICTTCGEPVDENSSVIYGVERDGKMQFGWACCHKPVGDVAVILASLTCAETWLRDHPEYMAAVSAIIRTAHTPEEHTE